MSFTGFIQDLTPPVIDPATVPSKKEQIDMLRSLPFDEFVDKLVHGAVTLVVNVMIAILVFYAGRYIIGKLYQVVRRIMLRRRVEPTLASFVLSFVRIVLYFILIVTVIGILGIETSSFLAIFASAGVAIGMALSGTLQNFAGGVLILLLKPYRVGDYIDTQGYQGEVKEIQIFHTVLLTPDNKSIIIPNGGLSTGSINNWSKEKFRRVDWTVGISYGDSVATAREAILDILKANPMVVDRFTADFRMPSDCPDTPISAENCRDDSTAGHAACPADADTPDNGDCEPEDEKAPRRSFLDFFRSHKKRLQRLNRERIMKIEAAVPPKDCSPSVVVNELADSAVSLKVRAWVPTALYWAVYYRVLEDIYTILPTKGVNFPFPQLDVHCIPPAAPSPPDKPTADK